MLAFFTIYFILPNTIFSGSGRFCICGISSRQKSIRSDPFLSQKMVAMYFRIDCDDLNFFTGDECVWFYCINFVYSLVYGELFMFHLLSHVVQKVVTLILICVKNSCFTAIQFLFVIICQQFWYPMCAQFLIV